MRIKLKLSWVVDWRGNGATIFKKLLGRNLPFNPAIAFLGKYVHKKIGPWMFISTWFIISPNWKQPRYSSGRDWTNCGIFIGGKWLSPKTEGTANKQGDLFAWKNADRKEHILTIPCKSGTNKAKDGDKRAVVPCGGGVLWQGAWGHFLEVMGTFCNFNWHYCCMGR